MRTLIVVTLLAGAAVLGPALSRWKPVQMPFDAARFTPREREMVSKLVAASRSLEDIFWRQSDPEGLALLAAAVKSGDHDLRRLLMINGSRFDLIDGNRPFVGDQPFAPGGGLYPRGLTREEIDKYVQAHSDRRAAIYSPYTVVRKRGGELVAIPYHVEYRPFLEQAVRDLRAAAALSDDARFARFLKLRADALLSDDYYASDVAWLELDQPKFDVIFAPYETYLDGVLGVKTSYGAAVLIRNDEESRKLAVYEKYVPELQDALPLAAPDRPSKRGHETPMEVVDSPFRTGDLRHGYQAVADNLPNDPRIHAEKGSKKIFFKNFLDARVDFIVVPLASRLLIPSQAALVSREGYTMDTLLHEIAHGLGPTYARAKGKQTDIREAIGPQFPGLEEAKADVVGLLGAGQLAARGVLTRAQLESAYVSHVADLLRMLRFGTAEAHAVSEIMQFSYLANRKVIAWDAKSKRYTVDLGAMPGAIRALAKELLEIEATGDAARAQTWFARHTALPPELAPALRTTADVPVDLDPVFSFPDLPR